MTTEDKKCAVCKSDKGVEFIQIADCDLCEKCQKELAESFELVMTADRSDYPEI